MEQEQQQQASQSPQQAPEQDTYSYNGWMHSDNFLKRAFAVWGHYFVANLIIAFGMFIIFAIITFVGVMAFGQSFS